MTRTCVDDSVPATTSQPRGSNHSFAQCRCGLMWVSLWLFPTFSINFALNSRKDGIKFNSIFLTSPDVLMERIMLKLSAFRFTQTAEFAAFTSQIDFTPKTNCRQSSSFSCRFKNRNSQKSPPRSKLLWEPKKFEGKFVSNKEFDRENLKIQTFPLFLQNITHWLTKFC